MEIFKNTFVKSFLVILPFLVTEIKASTADACPVMALPCPGERTLPLALEIGNLHDLPDFLRPHLQKGYQLGVFLDFDDTLARKTLQRGERRFEYLPSPEFRRMMEPYVDPIIEEVAVRRQIHVTEVKYAIDYLREHHPFHSYHYTDEGSFQDDLHAPLRAIGAVVKICSGLPIDGDAARLPFIESLGLTPNDYVHAGGFSKLTPILDSMQVEGNNYTVILVDNNPGVIEDFSWEAQCPALMVHRQASRINFITVLHTQFRDRLAANQAQLAQEIDWAIDLYRAREREMIESGACVISFAPPQPFSFKLRRPTPLCCLPVALPVCCVAASDCGSAGVPDCCPSVAPRADCCSAAACQEDDDAEVSYHLSSEEADIKVHDGVVAEEDEEKTGEVKTEGDVAAQDNANDDPSKQDGTEV